MDLSFTDEELAFQAEVRDFLEKNLPADVKDRYERGLHFTKEGQVRWQRILNEKGWLAPGWPVEYGGTGWTATQKYIFSQELGRASAPPPIPFGINMVGPVIYTFGNQEQKDLYLPRILNSDDWWCQGYSEPGSGSDLASLQTKAVRDGDDYIVNGQKIWTSHAQHADMIFCLVRTDSNVKQQEGISFLLIDMKTPGITLKPIIGLDTEHTLNEVFFDDVRVPVKNRIGEENKGWTYAKFLLGNERTSIARISQSKLKVKKLRDIAASQRVSGGLLQDDADFMRKLNQIDVDLMALEYTELRMLSRIQKGEPLTAEPSMLKIKGSDIQQALTELSVEALGLYGAAYESQEIREGRNDQNFAPDYANGPMAEHLYLRAASIYGGSNEIQRNIISKMVLGL
ncbi:pimeloyl-CoA dehydrogenase large subunit [Sneathiella sp. P13V-1]|uniref:acyl-CoA dehydrogenase family protein n=1 Tax=Sneathiella sp. P13V-1 TaxID=2697366 RepID=UPI00187B2747|nr:acyl-CoA dehydrogenase family protein [Sneathiella sp. P13V-1]MBE7635356.1 pimeloyl-CoA dehydrogenase large subunit [Sneathiella sp. P13V-1]